MTPIVFPLPPAPPSREESLAKYQRGVDSVNRMCLDLKAFLGMVFPDAKIAARTFTESLALYLNHNTLEYMEQLRNPPAMPEGYGPSPWDPTEQLVQLCKRRDQIQGQLDSVRFIAKTSLGHSEEAKAVLESQITLSGMPQQLEDINEQISKLQAKIEAATK